MGITYSPYFKVKLLNLTNSTTVASGGGTNTQTLRPSAGFVRSVFDVYGLYPAIGGASGDHKLEFILTDGTNTDEIIEISGTDGALFYFGGKPGLVGDGEQPSGINQQMMWLTQERIIVSNDYYLEFLYTNNSDTNQTGQRKLYVWVKEFPEAK